MLRMRDRVNEILAKHTGKTEEKIHRDTERDYILDAEEAVAYGIVDQGERRKPRRKG